MARGQVLAFFTKLGMPLPERPPLLLVDSESLGNAREVEGDCSHGQPHSSPGAPTAGPVLHTRGLCLWQVSGCTCVAAGMHGTQLGGLPGQVWIDSKPRAIRFRTPVGAWHRRH